MSLFVTEVKWEQQNEMASSMPQDANLSICKVYVRDEGKNATLKRNDTIHSCTECTTVQNCGMRISDGGFKRQIAFESAIRNSHSAIV
jgi:squalene cyclase